jgi:hypothetical protein
MALVFVLDGLLLRIEDQRELFPVRTLHRSFHFERFRLVDQQPKDRCHRMLYASISSEAELCDFLE